MFTDIRRICSEPTAEDCEYFPHLANTEWLPACLDAVKNYRDESFITQFLSPAIMRKWRLFEIDDQQSNNYYEVSGIQDSRGYAMIKESLSHQYSVSKFQPDIQVVDANLKGDRTLVLEYTKYNQRELDKNKDKVLEYIKYLWGYSVDLRTAI